MKKTPEISIFLIGVLVRRTIFSGPVVLDVFLGGASIESIEFTIKCHFDLLKFEKLRKTAIFGHIWEYLAIDGPSCPIWVEHRLNRVEHCISHMGGPVRPPKNDQKRQTSKNSGGFPYPPL